MGGFALWVRIAPQKEDAASPRALYDAMFDAVGSGVRRLAKGKAYDRVLTQYVPLCRDDGADGVSREELVFEFRDCAGRCFTSMRATMHWFELALSSRAFDELAASLGYEISDTWPVIEARLAVSKSPLVELRGELYTVADGPEISADVIDGALSASRLDAKERELVTSIAEKRKCACKVCEALRDGKSLAPKIKPKKEPKKKKEKPQTALAKKRTLSIQSADSADLQNLAEAKGLKELSIYAEGLETLPDAIGGLAKLERLTLMQLAIKELPPSFAKLRTLRDLTILACKVRSVAGVEELENLEKLRLSGNSSLGAVPSLEKLSKLKRVEINNCGIASFPIFAKDAPLEDLRLESNALTSVDEIASFPRLEHVELRGNPLGSLPSLAKLEALKALYIDGTRIQRLDAGVLPPNVERIGLSNSTELEALPTDLFERPIEWMHLGVPKIASLPSEIGKLQKLRGLRLSGSTFAELPDTIGDLALLTQLDLSGLPLRTLPDALRKLVELEELDLSGVPLETLPDWLGELTALRRVEITQSTLVRGEKTRIEKMLRGAKIAWR